MRRLIAAIVSWLRGWSTPAPPSSAYLDAAPNETVEDSDEVSFDGYDDSAPKMHGSARTVKPPWTITLRTADSRLNGGGDIANLERLRADSTALIAAATRGLTRGINDEEIEAAQRLRERSENAHKQPCAPAIDARIAALTSQLADERRQRQEIQQQLASAAGAERRATRVAEDVRQSLLAALTDLRVTCHPLIEGSAPSLAARLAHEIHKLTTRLAKSVTTKRSRAKQPPRARRA